MTPKVVGFICGPKIYKYNGVLFEWHNYCGPAQLKKDGELYKNYCSNKFLDKIDRFIKMSEKERKKYKVGGIGGYMSILQEIGNGKKNHSVNFLDNTYNNLSNKNCTICGKHVPKKGYVIDGCGISIQHAKCFKKCLKKNPF